MLLGLADLAMEAHMQRDIQGPEGHIHRALRWWIVGCLMLGAVLGLGSVGLSATGAGEDGLHRFLHVVSLCVFLGGWAPLMYFCWLSRVRRWLEARLQIEIVEEPDVDAGPHWTPAPGTPMIKRAVCSLAYWSTMGVGLVLPFVIWLALM